MFPAAVVREVFRKSTLVMGGALSIGVHLLLGAAVLLPLSGAPMLARADLDGAPPVLTLDEPAPPVTVPQTNITRPDPDTTVAVPAMATPAPQPAVRRPRRAPPLPRPQDPASELPPAPPPMAAPAAAVRMETAPTQIVAQPPARPTASRPYLSAGVAAGLRVYDNFPRMPEPLRGPGVQYMVAADVCVTERGTVDRVRVSAPAGAAALEHAVSDAIRTWRYRPLITSGGPSAFCHQLNMRYALE